jgi:hypothetical protein
VTIYFDHLQYWYCFYCIPGQSRGYFGFGPGSLNPPPPPSQDTFCPEATANSFLGQNEIHSDLMSWQLVRVRVNISLKLFFSETIIPRKLIFCRNVPWVGIFKICSQGSEIPNNFRTGSEKPQKLA